MQQTPASACNFAEDQH